MPVCKRRTIVPTTLTQTNYRQNPILRIPSSGKDLIWESTSSAVVTNHPAFWYYVHALRLNAIYHPLLGKRNWRRTRIVPRPDAIWCLVWGTKIRPVFVGWAELRVIQGLCNQVKFELSHCWGHKSNDIAMHAPNNEIIAKHFCANKLKSWTN